MMPRRANITDRALRYRAVKNHPPGEKRCAFCGGKQQVQVGHVDGHEENGDAANLIWTCRSCNQLASNSLRRAGLGRLTNQYNPSGGAKTLGAWLSAVSVVTPHKDRGQGSLFPQAGNEMSIRDAVQLIRDTPASRRSSFAREIAERKRSRARYNPCKTRKNIWPFSSSPSRESVSWSDVRKRRGLKASTYKGYRITPGDDGFQALDSTFDTVKDAKRFIDVWEKRHENPAAFDRCVKALRKKGTVVNEYAVCKAAMKKKRGNPADASAQAYEDFHGEPPTEHIKVTRRIHFHKHVAGAGLLPWLKVLTIDGKAITTIHFKGTYLAFNEQRNQLFVEGGDQSVNLRDFGIKPEKAHELETLGQVKQIGYKTDKTHLGDEGGKALYVHTFRMTNQDGKHVTVRIARYPDLIYRRLDEQLEFSGGSYEILPEGIDR